MKVVLIGNGGHSKVIQDIIRSINELELLAILDDKYDGEMIINGKVYAPISFLERLLEKGTKVVVAIGSNVIRQSIVQKMNLNMESYLTLIHPSAVISTSAVIGYGTVIMPNAVINSDTTIGDQCIINTGAIIEHDNAIGDYSHVSPNATLTGNVRILEGVHIGASATIIPGIEIGEWSVIGAGSTVIKNIPPSTKAVGSPTRFIDYSRQF
ncbi:acetyltransferase [Cytobacillus sp. S13-E01]|uniref:acetyltransferase n=1 Tax=Cytobacillus sp. S13-E01 TaxID=3031326 RepID=UPI0023D7E899|nr:acetyltransferase [Cytobacillus sp. S13-E01]MDF0727767.1 acetyltransferase [Cytobacillus sp. S13-E01]